MSAGTAQPLAYHHAVRREVVPFLKADSRILEIGCGTGATLDFLRQQGLCRWAGGVEYAPEPAELARKVADQVWQGDIEGMDLGLAEGSLDAVLCLDVLEHLVNPWRTARRLAALLAPGGVLVASLPNIRNDRILRDLVLRGKWEYRDDGILDRTHLRFFTRASTVALVAEAGLTVEAVQPLVHLKPWRLKWILNRVSGGRMVDFYATQFLVCGRR
ncbi:MAG: class I SAM-dependent methyltransferase [Magnetospirillum sp.]|nr:class I SAM-dependent methyltransferase [Magnetospirillum sp.]